MSVPRSDLLVLTEDALTALANRGLVKRAIRELADVPPVSVAADGAVTAKFADGAEATLPPGQGLDTASCTCSAPGVCRHRIGAVLAYQRDQVVVRADLLALTEDALAALANRGLVKRAIRELADVPPVSVAADGAVTAKFADGSEATLPPGQGLDTVSCTCSAPGVCRHRIGAVLAYQRDHVVASVGVRSDLLALTEDALAALANRGLVKRATKDLTGIPPVSVAADGAVTAKFADGAEAILPPGQGLDTASCTCSAPGVCRHRIGAVLAYQRDHQAPLTSEAPTGWPGSVTDDELTARFGARTMTAARRRLGNGFAARVRRPAATVETPAATVRFLVPGELGFVDCDAREDARDALIVLAVWAFRRADAEHPGEPEVTVELAAPSTEPTMAFTDAAAAVLRSGVTSADDVLLAALRRERDACDRAGLRWPAAALDDLAAQLSAYRNRSAAHVPERVAELIAEVHARRHAASTAPARVLGTEEAAETPLRQVRLIGLGCRIDLAEGEPGADTAEVFLAHPGTETVLAVRHRWARRADGANPAVPARRVAGATLAALAAGNVVSEAAVRSAGRVVRFGSGRLARTTVSPLGDAWAELPKTLCPPTIAAAEQALAGLPPRVVRPRVAAEFVCVLPVADVRQVRYVAGAQRLEALIADADGTTATVTLTHRAATPGALDALASALSDGPTAISGVLRRSQGGLQVEPYAVRTESGVVVPDLADVRADVPPAGGRPDREPLAAAIDDALALLADAAHRGLAHLPPTTRDRAERAASALVRVGLARCASAITDWSVAVGDPAVWLRAEIRLLAAAEVC